MRQIRRDEDHDASDRGDVITPSGGRFGTSCERRDVPPECRPARLTLHGRRERSIPVSALVENSMYREMVCGKVRKRTFRCGMNVLDPVLRWWLL